MTTVSWRAFWGIDFSGARDAGKHIRIAKAESCSDGLYVTDVARLTATHLEPALRELRWTISQAGPIAIGGDWPFGLPRTLAPETTWHAMLAEFRARYADPDAFRNEMRRLGSGRELRRVTDVVARTPMAPSNLRLYKQTYYGIRDVLWPLTASGEVRVAPMQPPCADRPTLIEVCPRSTRKSGGVATGSGEGVLLWLARQRVTLEDHVRACILGDRRGDALDSTLAAFATWRAASAGAITSAADFNVVEGHVFV